MKKLTKTAIEAVTTDKDEIWLPDGDLPGFYARIRPGRRKTYVCRYRNKYGRQRKYTIGRCCDMAPDKARELARKVFAAVAEGKDPAEDKRALMEAPTLLDLKNDYMAKHARPFKKQRSADNDETNWTLHVLPTLGEKTRVAEVTKDDVLKLKAKLADKKATANACIALLSKAMNLAEDWKWRPQNSNPCRRLPKYKINERECILSPEQIGALDRTLDEMVDEKAIPYPMAALVRLWLITGCRNSEIRTAERAWVDFNRQLLLLPDSKVGQRRIPLPDAAIAIIKTLPEGKWLIPGRKAGDHLKSPWDMFKRICKRAGIPLEMRPHDLRHTVGSLGHDNGLSQKQIAQQLGHRQLSTTERYIHGVKSSQAKAAATIAEVITVNFNTKERVATAQDQERQHAVA